MRDFSYAFKLSFNCLALRILRTGLRAGLARFSLGNLPVAISWSINSLMW
jgi:hypothetical protein